jgi:hypothetical protein
LFLIIASEDLHAIIVFLSETVETIYRKIYRNWKKMTLSHPSESHVNFCHYLASFVCLIIFHIWIFSSETTWSNEPRFYRKCLCKSPLYDFLISSRFDKNMVDMCNSCFWLADLKKYILSSETRRHNELLLRRNDVWEVLYSNYIFRADIAVIGSSPLWLAN